MLTGDQQGEVMGLERELKKLDETVVSHGLKIKDIKEKIFAVESWFGFREWYLGGRFGGNRMKVLRHKVLKNHLSSLNATLDSEMKESDQKYYAINKTIMAYLVQNVVPDFIKLTEVLDRVTKFKKEVDHYAGLVEDALGEVDDAQSWETIDLVSDNNGFSFVSHMETEEAADAIENVNEATERFQNAVKEYKAFTQSKPVSDLTDVKLDDTLDLFMDFAFDGFDFMSIINLSELNDAEDALNNLNSEVSRIKEVADQHYSEAKANIEKYVAVARKTCVN